VGDPWHSPVEKYSQDEYHRYVTLSTREAITVRLSP
jgi:hypothetical protein